MTTKKCSKCEEVKPLTDYYKRSASKDGLCYQCKTCKNKTAMKWQQTDKYKTYKAEYAKRPEVVEKNRQYYKDNKEAIIERARQYQLDNKEYVAERSKQYRLANKEIIAERNKQYQKENLDAVAKYGRRYKRERRKTDPLFRLRCNIGKSIRQSLINGGYSKKSRTHKILGCSYEEYYQHIESQFTEGMSWDVMSEIHIDHRLPVSAATTEAELLALNHHRNLQPLWKSDNLAKGSSYCPKELAAYFKKHL